MDISLPHFLHLQPQSPSKYFKLPEHIHHLLTMAAYDLYRNLYIHSHIQKIFSYRERLIVIACEGARNPRAPQIRARIPTLGRTEHLIQRKKLHPLQTSSTKCSSNEHLSSSLPSLTSPSTLQHFKLLLHIHLLCFLLVSAQDLSVYCNTMTLPYSLHTLFMIFSASYTICVGKDSTKFSTTLEISRPPIVNTSPTEIQTPPPRNPNSRQAKHYAITRCLF